MINRLPANKKYAKDRKYEKEKGKRKKRMDLLPIPYLSFFNVFLFFFLVGTFFISLFTQKMMEGREKKKLFS